METALTLEREKSWESQTARFKIAAEKLNLDPGLWRVLQQPNREIIVHIPVMMDNHQLEVFTGYRMQHSIARGRRSFTGSLESRLPRAGAYRASDPNIFSPCCDANKQYFDGAKTYRVTLPKGIPQANFWSLTPYHNQSRSMLHTPQRYPRAGSQSYPSPAAEPNANGSTTVYFGPKQMDGVRRGNWIQTTPGKGWFMLLRLYNPLELFFTKEWRSSEIELVK